MKNTWPHTYVASIVSLEASLSTMLVLLLKRLVLSR